MKTTPVQEITLPEFEAKVLRCAQPVLAGFSSGWSQPCARFEPFLEEVAKLVRRKGKRA